MRKKLKKGKFFPFQTLYKILAGEYKVWYAKNNEIYENRHRFRRNWRFIRLEREIFRKYKFITGIEMNTLE